MNEKEKKSEQESGGLSSWKERLKRHIPILKWLPRYKKMDLVADMIAGLTVGLTLIPQSVAYAGLAGLSPEYGLYASFMGSFIYVVFGTVKEVSMGPTSLLCLLTFEFTKDLPKEFVFLLAFLSGSVEFLLGLLQFGFLTIMRKSILLIINLYYAQNFFYTGEESEIRLVTRHLEGHLSFFLFCTGFLVNFISIPVTTSFQSAVALIIISSQVRDLLGVSKFKSGRFLSNFVAVGRRLKETRMGDLTLSVFCCTFLLLLRKLKDINFSKNKEPTGNEKFLKKTLWFLSISRNAICVLISCVLAYIFSLNGQTPFKLSGNIPSGLPPFQPPHFSIQNGNETVTFTEAVYKISTGILVIPLISILANVTIAKAFSAGSPVDATQEMITLGLCNISGAFVSSLPTCGAFTRSAVSNSSGVRTPLAGLFTGTLIVLVITFLTPYFYYIPRATLASVLVCAVIFMIDWRTVFLLWRVNKIDFLCAITTFSACLMLGIQTGLLFGVFVNTGHLLYLWARPSVSVQVMTTTEGSYYKVKPDLGLYFPATDYIRNTVTNQCVQKIPVVFDCIHFKGIDYTTAQAIKELGLHCKRRDQKLIFLNMSYNIYKFLKNSNVDIKLKQCAAPEDLTDILFYSEEKELFAAVLLESDSMNMKIEVKSEGKPLLKH